MRSTAVGRPLGSGSSASGASPSAAPWPPAAPRARRGPRGGRRCRAVAAMAKPRSTKLRGGPRGRRPCRGRPATGTRGRRRAAGRPPRSGLGERQAEGAVDAHHLAGRAHLGAEDRVGVGEAVERQHRLLHRDVAAVDRRRAAGPRPAARRAWRPTITRAATFTSGTPGGLGHERHGAAGPGVGLDDEDLALLDRVLHVDEARGRRGRRRGAGCSPR